MSSVQWDTWLQRVQRNGILSSFKLDSLGLAAAWSSDWGTWLLLMEVASSLCWRADCNPRRVLWSDLCSDLEGGCFLIADNPCDPSATNREFCFYSIAGSRCRLFDPRTVHATNKTSPKGKNAFNLQAVLWSVPCTVKFPLCKLRLDMYPYLNCRYWEKFPSLVNLICICYGLFTKNDLSHLIPSIFCRIPIATCCC